MTVGASLWSDINSLHIDEIYEQTLQALYARTYLLPTVMNFTATGVSPRKVNTHGTAAVKEVPEGSDMTPEKRTKAALSTLTVSYYGDQYLLTDQDVATDPDNAVMEAVFQLTEGFSQHVDKNIASNFTSLNGGTVGSYANALSWANLFDAFTRLKQKNVPGPYFCVLGFGQWNYLAGTALITGSQLANAPQFQDRFLNNYFVPSMFGGEVTVVVSNNIPGAISGTATGAMYSRMAMAYDERRGFMIEPQRDASRSADELNATLWYAHGTWRPVAGVQIRSKDDPV